MKKVIINAKVDPVLKRRAQRLAQELDIPLSSVISAALRDFVALGSVTISTSGSPPAELDRNQLAELARLAVRKGRLKTSTIQRKLTVSYPKALKIMSALQRARVIDKSGRPLIKEKQAIGLD